MRTNYNISLADLPDYAEIEASMKAVDSCDDFPLKNTLRANLYKYGMAINAGYEYQFCEHRTVFGKRVKTLLFQGYERDDDNWIKIRQRALSHN